jgi:hypothetical protein
LFLTRSCTLGISRVLTSIVEFAALSRMTSRKNDDT